MLDIDEEQPVSRRLGLPEGVALVRRLSAAAVAILFAAGLCGCSGIRLSETSVIVASGKYHFNSCQDIDRQIINRKLKLTELETMMAQASQSAGGAFVNAIAYRTDYAQNRAELAELVRTAQEKACTSQSEWSSVRAVF